MPLTHLAFNHVSVDELKLRCIYLHNLDPSERCKFVNSSFCDEDSELFMYHYIMFCGIPNPSFENILVILYIIAMALWFLFLFMVLAVIVDEYFCPAIGTLSKILHLSENLSGVTLLALGNGMPDILTAVSSSEGSTVLMFNQIMGSGIFVSCIVVGSIAIARPFYIQPYHFVRDLAFALTSICWVEFTVRDEKVAFWEAISYIIMYILYLVIVIGGYFVQDRISRWMIKEQEVDWTELRRRRTSLGSEEDDGDDEIGFFVEEKISGDSVELDNEPESAQKLFRDFCRGLSPLTSEWKTMSRCDKTLTVIRGPFHIMLNFIIPVVSAGIKRRGWNKLLNCLHCIVFPFIFAFATKSYEKFGYEIFMYVAPSGFVVAILVFCTSKQNTPPVYHNVFAFISFITGIMIIFITVQEIVGVLNLFGTLLQVTPQMLGITLLAWGNSLGDAVANTQIARAGFQRMAFAACFAGIIANVNLSMGLTFLVRHYQTAEAIEARSGIMGPNCSVFLIMSFTYTIFYILLTRYQARKSYGIFLFLLYVEFLVFNILCEIEIIHPLGTDHDFSFDMYNVSSVD